MSKMQGSIFFNNKAGSKMNLSDSNNCKIINERILAEIHLVDSSERPEISDYKELFENVLYVMTGKNYLVNIQRDR